MAMIFESDEEEDLGEMLDETDDDDDDYVPDGANSDSDPDYGKRKRRSSSSSPTKGTRSSSRASSKSFQKKTRKGSTVTPKKHGSAKKQESPKKRLTPKRKTPAVKLSKPARKDKGDSVRRSSRSSRSRSVSYADADLSEEEAYGDGDLSDDSEDLMETPKAEIKRKKETERKKRVENLWSSFKEDVDQNTNKVSQTVDTKQGQSKIEDKKASEEITEMPAEKVAKLEKNSSVESDQNKEDSKCSKNVTSPEKDFELKSDNEKKNDCVVDKNSSGSNGAGKKTINTVIPISESSQQSKTEGTVVQGSNVTTTNSDNLKNQNNGKVTITETFDFAGEQIKTTKTVDATSKEAKKFQSNNSADKNKDKPGASHSMKTVLSTGLKKPGGLGSVLGSLEKKKKMSVLDKSKHDWNSYKDDLGIEDELKGNRNAGYLDRQDFLQRVDYKQWENEREMRLYSNRK